MSSAQAGIVTQTDHLFQIDTVFGLYALMIREVEPPTNALAKPYCITSPYNVLGNTYHGR
jgi:hypothetical protein